MPEATQARQVHLWGQEGAFYGQESLWSPCFSTIAGRE
jgi:hypothetical protein